MSTKNINSRPIKQLPAQAKTIPNFVTHSELERIIKEYDKKILILLEDFANYAAFISKLLLKISRQ